MKRSYFSFIILVLTAISLTQCAKKGTISGGAKDEIPPKLLKAIPEQNTTNFKAKVIDLYFDEYVKLKDLNKNLIISPPLKYKPLISPQGTASKRIRIKIQDTLKDNTTYIFNFGQSVADNNEGNIYPNFSYVFATGNHIDSLSLKGEINDVLLLDDPKDITVMLYEIMENYSDSIIYKQKPDYLTNTLDANIFNFTNLRAGTYRLVAIEDLNNNQKYNPKTEKIAFLSEPINLPDTLAKTIQLFKATIPFKALKPKNEAKGRVLFPFEGDSLEVSIKPNATNFDYFVQKIPAKDSLVLWYKNIAQDSLIATVNKADYTKKYTVKLRRKRQDTILLTANKGTIRLDKKIAIQSATPIAAIDDTKIILLDRDSVAVAFKTSINTNKDAFLLDFKLAESQKYQLTVLPETLTDFFGNKNKDTIQTTVSTKKRSDYGTLKITLKNKNTAVFVHILNARTQKVVQEKYLDKNNSNAYFEYLNPTNYLVRLLVDTNNNQRWDTGNLMEKTQAERVIYLPKPIEIRANWDLEETFELK